MTAAVRLANGDCNLRHGSFAIGEHQFGSVIDDAGVLLACTAQEARNINKGKDLDVECVAETYETCGLAAGVAVKHTGKPVRLVGNDTCRAAVETSETADDVLGIILVNLHEVTVVNDGVDDVLHIVGLVRIIGNDLVQAVLDTCGIIGALNKWSFLHIVLRDERNETTNLGYSLLLGSGNEMCHAGFGGMHLGTTQLLNRHILTRHALHNLRAGDEHVRVLLGHHDEVRESRGVNRTAGTRAKDHTDLRHNARCKDITLEDLGITGECTCTLLDTRTARIVQSDDRCTEFHSHIHHVADLLCHGLRQRTADNRCILSEHKYQTAVDRTRTAGYAITEEDLLLHTEVVATVGEEHINLLERTFVE